MKTDTKWKKALAQNKPVFSRIYHAMGDETSKRLYESLLRLQYTGDVQYLIEAVQLNGFEPDPVNYEICCQKLQEQTEGALARNSKIIHAGVSDRCAVMCFHAAEQAIRRCRPRMAVCAYHKLEDLLKIPKWILDLEMGYTLQLRMYSNEYLEIVCYAY